MLTQLRPALFASALAAGIWAGAASAQWQGSSVVRLEPGYGGVCEACDLSGRILAGARMRGSVFNRADFSGAVLTRADATGSRFEGADFTEADLTSAKLTEASCEGADFSSAVLTRAVAHRTRFARADFTRARLDEADFSGADLRGARGLTQAQLNSACGDAATRLPRGLRLPACG